MHRDTIFCRLIVFIALIVLSSNYFFVWTSWGQKSVLTHLFILGTWYLGYSGAVRWNELLEMGVNTDFASQAHWTPALGRSFSETEFWEENRLTAFNARPAAWRKFHWVCLLRLQLAKEWVAVLTSYLALTLPEWEHFCLSTWWGS